MEKQAFTNLNEKNFKKIMNLLKLQVQMKAKISFKSVQQASLNRQRNLFKIKNEKLKSIKIGPIFQKNVL